VPDAPTPLTVRPIRPADAPLLEAGLARLSPQSVYQRFLSPKPRLSRRELRYLTEVDGVMHHALVALDADGDLVAVGRWVRDADRPEEAEIAIVVADCLQRRGVGRGLGLALADAACAHGVRRFTATILPGNRAAERLLAVVQERLEARPCSDPSPVLAAA
jgi:GNAT superfamily N-acetyltransferase